MQRLQLTPKEFKDGKINKVSAVFTIAFQVHQQVAYLIFR